MGPLQGAADRRQQLVHLSVDDDSVEALLAAEVLVDDGLGHSGRRRDLLDADSLETLLGKEGAADGDELLTPFAS
jgi:hypothetical protein